MTSKKSCKKLKILKGLYSTSPKSTDHAWIIVADLLTGKSNKYMNVKKSSKNAHIKDVWETACIIQILMEQFHSSAKIAETFDEMETKMKNKLETLKIEAQRETEEGKRALSVDQFVYSSFI